MNDPSPKKTVLRRALAGYAPTALFVLFIAFSYASGFAPGEAIVVSFRSLVIQMASVLPAMFILVRLFDAWVPRQVVIRHIGEDSGWRGTALVILLAMLQAGPLYAAFPVASMLWKKGCTAFNICVYLGAFSAMKIPMLTFEIGFLGWEFSLLRLAFTLPVFIGIAAVLNRIFGLHGFHVSEKM